MLVKIEELWRITMFRENCTKVKWPLSDYMDKRDISIYWGQVTITWSIVMSIILGNVSCSYLNVKNYLMELYMIWSFFTLKSNNCMFVICKGGRNWLKFSNLWSSFFPSFMLLLTVVSLFFILFKFSYLPY